MCFFYFSISIFYLIVFYLVPIGGEFTDSRPILKFLSLFLFFLSVWSTWNGFKNKTIVVQQSPTSNPKFFKEIIFTICILFFFSYSYLFKLFEHLNSFFLVDYDYIGLAEILNNSLLGFPFRTHHYGPEVYGNYLSHHFSPSIIILSPFLLLSETRLGYAYGLLFFIILTFVIFAFLLIKKNIRGNLFLFSMILFASNIYLNRLFFSYHFELLTVFFFLLFFLGKEINKFSISIVAFLFLLLLKEDISIYLTCLGVYFLIQKDWKYGVCLIVIPIIYFLFVPSFFRSFIDKSAFIDWLHYWDKWGVSYLEIATNLVMHPIEVLQIFFSKWKVFRDFLLSFSPVVLLSPSYLLITLPIFLLHFLSDRIWYNTLYNYYAYSVISFFVLNILFSIPKLENFKEGKYSLPAMILCVSISIYSGSGDKLFPYSKMNTDIDRVNALNNVLRDLPKAKTIATQFDMGGFIPRANPVYPLHEKNLDKDYLLIDVNRGITPYIERSRIQEMVGRILEKKTYSLIKENSGIQLYKKN